MKKGHDYSKTIRYREFRPVKLMICFDDDRPIPPGARAYRRVDSSQGNPVICLPCHEKIEHRLYARLSVDCICGEPLRWLNGSWVHESDHSIVRLAEIPCPHCDSGCRLCLFTSRVQVEDHHATPKESQ